VTSQFKEWFLDRHQRCREIHEGGRKVVACFYGLVPKELIHAAGMLPVQLVEERNPAYDERSQLLPYLCGMSKNLAGQLYSGVYDYVDGVMVATVCDTNRHVFDIWAHRKLFPHLWLVRTPTTAGDAALGYFTEEMRRLAGALSRLSGNSVTEEGLRASIALYNDNRACFRQLAEARAAGRISAQEALYAFGAALVMPVEAHNAAMRRLLDAAQPLPSRNESPRLMLSAIHLHMALDVIRTAEKYGASVVADDFAHNARYGSTPIDTDGDPFRALARGYLRRVPAPGMYAFEERAVGIREAMARSGAAGLIYLIQLYCDAFAMEYAILKERFDAWGVRHLKLEAEDNPSSMEQLNVRIQSFLESLA
jgi:benzoyl-CoA reductase/2-hydroxyglutaryl-CoA dehydratase subunit BcrC/BadD/HgdB